MDVEALLKALGEHIDAHVPERDARQTPDSPSLSKLLQRLEAGEEPTLQDETHPYVRAVRAAYLRSDAAVIIPDNTAPVTNISAELRDYAAHWLAQNQPADDEALAGSFDDKGVLHLSLHQLTVSGRVKVYLVADEMPLPIIETEIEGGRWEAAVALPDWNLRNIRLARSAVDLVPV